MRAVVTVKRIGMPLDKSISNDRRKRKLAARIKQGVAQQRAWCRAQRKAAEAAKNLALPRAVPALTVLNLTPQYIAGILEAARELREVAA